MDNNVNKNIKKVTAVQTWEDLFKLVIDVTKQDIRCSTLAFFDSFEQEYDENLGYGIAKMKPFPLVDNQSEYFIFAYFFKNNKDEEGQQIEDRVGGSKIKYYVVSFMDNNFKATLSNNEYLNTSDESYHTMNFGVLIDTL